VEPISVSGLSDLEYTSLLSDSKAAFKRAVIEAWNKEFQEWFDRKPETLEKRLRRRIHLRSRYRVSMKG